LSSSGAALLSCDDLELVMAEDGLRISFGGGALDLCPGCFLVGGPDNIMAAWQTIDGGDASIFPIAPPASPYCGRGATRRHRRSIRAKRKRLGFENG
jgi:hypothetical protein